MCRCGLLNANVYSDICSQFQALQRPLEIVIAYIKRVPFTLWNFSAATVSPEGGLTELRSE